MHRPPLTPAVRCVAQPCTVVTKALLRCAIPGQPRGMFPDAPGQMVSARSSKAMRSRWPVADVGGDVVVVAAQVLDEGVTGGEDPR
jgi:hypothetical protein